MTNRRKRLPRNPYIKAPFPWLRIGFLVCCGIILLWVGMALILHNRSVSVTSSVTSAFNELADKKEVEVSAKPQKRVGIQVGHWKMDELPSEFSETSRWNTGGSVNGVDEWEASLDVANQMQTILEKDGYTVDILPATIPVGYEADVFISLHTDGNDDASVSGFKVAANGWDETGRAAILASSIQSAYEKATNMYIEPNITEDMTEYYAFNKVKYNHSIASTTPGVILEYGFLTNYSDRSYIVNYSDKIAQAVVDGIEAYLGSN